MVKTPASSPDFHSGSGGETHQTASSPETRITTNHGMPIGDHQNSLKAGSRGPSLLEDFILHLKAIGFTPEAQPLLDKAGVEMDAGVLDVSKDREAWLGEAATRQWAREPKVRMLA